MPKHDDVNEKPLFDDLPVRDRVFVWLLLTAGIWGTLAVCAAIAYAKRF